MPSAPNEDAGARAWSWALTKAGSTRERGLLAGGAVSEMEVMRPLSCLSTTFSSRPRSGPQNRLCAGISVVMTCPPRHCERSEAIHRAAKARMDCFVASLLAMTEHLVRSIHQLPLRARRQELARENLRGR